MPVVTVSSPAADRRLCALEALKLELGIDASDTSADDWLRAECLSASDRVAEACGVIGDDVGDAPATFAEEEAVISFAAGEMPCGDILELPWRYPARVTAIAVGGTPLEPALYQVRPKGALVVRLPSSGSRARWERTAMAVTVRSGWEHDKVPTALQDAVKRLVRLRWETRDRDLTIKAEETASVGRTEYWVGSTGAAGSVLPADVLAALQAGGFACAVIP